MQNGPSGRALVVGSQTNGLKAVESDAANMAAMLEARGFVVDLRTQGDATRAGILSGYDALIASVSADEPAVFYYAGHGSRSIDTTRGSAAVLQDIVPTDYDAGTATDYRGISSVELSIKLRQLIRRTRNATVILDCCHSGQMSRGSATHDAAPRSLSHPQQVDFSAHMAALAAMYGPDLTELGTEGSPEAVKLVACAKDELAVEYTNDNGVRAGAFTEALLGLFKEIGESRITWSVLTRALRQRVLRRFPDQRPDVEGPADREPFALTVLPDDETVGIRKRDDGYWLDAGWIHGVNQNDVYEIVRVREPRRVVARARAGAPQSTAAPVTIEWLDHTSDRDLAGAIATRVTRAATRRPVTVIAPDAQRATIVAALEQAQTLRVASATDRDPSVAILRLTAGGLTIEDSAGPLFPAALYPDALPAAVQNLANLGVVQALSELGGAHGVSAKELEIEWGVVENGERRLQPEHGAALGLGDRVYCRVQSHTRRRLYIHIFNIGLQGSVAVLSNWAPSGILLEPGREVVLGEAFDGTLEGLALSWPDDLPRVTFPRTDTIFVIATGEPTHLGVLETVPVGMRSATRSRGSGLAQLLEQLQTGGTRNIETRSVEGHFAKALTFQLHPRTGRMTSSEFLIDAAPTALGTPRAVSAWTTPASAAAKTIAIRIGDLSIHDTHAWLATDVRIDALVCTRATEPEPGYRPQTLRFSRIRSGDQAPLRNALLYHGPVRDFVDICLWVSRDPGNTLSLMDLIAARANQPDVKDALGALLVTAGAVAAPWVTAVGASAVLARVAYEAITKASGTSIGLYRTSFLTSEDYGIGRYPTTGSYRAQDFSFSLVISDATGK